MQRVLDFLTWGFLFIFFVPTFLIVATWNTLPGDVLYPTKLTLEQALLLFARPSYAVEGKLHIKYTERRFAESKRLLANRHSVKGLPYLTAQIAATKIVIYRAPSRQQKMDLAREYVTTLKTVDTQLEEEKQVILEGQITETQAQVPGEQTVSVTISPTPPPTELPATATPTASVTPTSVPWQNTWTTPTSTTAPVAGTSATTAPTVAVTPQPTATVTRTPTTVPMDDVPQQITQTQQTIEQTIDELEDVAQGTRGGSGRSPGRANIREQEEEFKSTENAGQKENPAQERTDTGKAENAGEAEKSAVPSPEDTAKPTQAVSTPTKTPTVSTSSPKATGESKY